MLRDELTGATHEVAARAVVNAAGVWAGDLVDHVRLRPSRGTHLVLAPEALPGLGVALTLPVPGERNRFLTVVPQQEGPVYVGLTDVPVDERDAGLPDVPEPSDAEIEFLARGDLVGPGPAAETGRRRRRVRRAAPAAQGRGPHLRPLAPSRRADLGRAASSRSSAASSRPTGGWRRTPSTRPCGAAGWTRPASTTARLPLAGAAPRAELARLAAASPAPRLVRRFGTDAALVLASAREVSGLADEELLAPGRGGGRGHAWPSWSSG